MKINTLKNITLLHIFILWSVNLSAADKINVDGTRFKVAMDNVIELTNSSAPNKWQNVNKFTTLRYSEHNRTMQQVHRQILQSVDDSLNQFQLNELSHLKNSDDLVVVKSLIAGTEFIRLWKLVGDKTSCAVLDLSLPLSTASIQQSEIEKMLNSLVWESTNLLVLNENPSIQLVKPSGFKVTKKYANSLVMQTTGDDSQALEANLVLSILSENVTKKDLVQKTENILTGSKTLEKIKIIELTEVKTEHGNMVIARASGRYEASQIEIDVSHTTLKLGDHLLIAQLITNRSTESFLKLEDVMIQVLANLKYQQIEKPNT